MRCNANFITYCESQIQTIYTFVPFTLNVIASKPKFPVNPIWNHRSDLNNKSYKVAILFHCSLDMWYIAWLYQQRYRYMYVGHHLALYFSHPYLYTTRCHSCASVYIGWKEREKNKLKCMISGFLQHIYSMTFIFIQSMKLFSPDIVLQSWRLLKQENNSCHKYWNPPFFFFI